MFRYLANRKKLEEQRQWASDTIAVYRDLEAQVEALSALKERNPAEWPAEVDLMNVKRNMLPAGKRTLELVRAIREAKEPIAEPDIIELQTIAASIVKTMNDLGDKVAFLVGAEVTRKAAIRSGGFGRKAT
jgi:hypothetical protein